MANVKISDLPAATSFGATDTVPIVQSGITKKVAGSLISATATDVQTTTVSTIQQMISANVPAGNAELTASVAANAITIALKTLAGSDATATDAITAVLRSATISNGSLTAYTLSGALTTVISSGSTLGCSASEAVRIHIGAMLNASTGVELFYWTASVSATLPIKLFDPTELVTTTAEGGAGGADSAQTTYSTTARTSQPWVYLGYIEATSSSTAGQWSSIDKIVNWQPGVPMPGDVIQTVRTEFTDVATGTTIMPTDDTIPQITEGDQYMTQAITPVNIRNKLRITAQAFFSWTAEDNGTQMALFQDATADALSTSVASARTTVASLNPTYFDYMMRAGTVSETTFRIRSGCAAVGTTTFNGGAGVRFYGGTINSFMRIEEIQA